MTEHSKTPFSRRLGKNYGEPTLDIIDADGNLVAKIMGPALIGEKDANADLIVFAVSLVESKQS